MSLSKTIYPLLSTGSTQKDMELSQLYWKFVDWDVQHHTKQTDLKAKKPLFSTQSLSITLKQTGSDVMMGKIWSYILLVGVWIFNMKWVQGSQVKKLSNQALDNQDVFVCFPWYMDLISWPLTNVVFKYVFSNFSTKIYVVGIHCDASNANHNIWAATRENLSSGFLMKWDSNQPAQLQRLVRDCSKSRFDTFH